MKKKWKRQQKRCRKIFQKWTYLLGLRWWEISVEYYIDKNVVDGSCLFGRATVKWQYMWAAIEVNLFAAAQRDGESLEFDILHELMHVLVNEMREPDEDLKHEERVCTTLAKAFHWTRNLKEIRK